MEYSKEPRFRKYMKGSGLLSFARKFGDKYGKKLMDTATKTWIEAAKTASKRVVQKTAKATEDLIGNKIADKITLIGKPKEKEKTKEIEQIYIPPEKRQQVIDDLRFVIKKWIEVDDQSGGNCNVKKEIKIKALMLRTDLCDFNDAYIVVKENIIADK